MASTGPRLQHLLRCVLWLLVLGLLFQLLRLGFGDWRQRRMRGKMDREENREQSNVDIGKGKRSVLAGGEAYRDCPWGSGGESGSGNMRNDFLENGTEDIAEVGSGSGSVGNVAVRIDGAVEAEEGEKAVLMEVCEEEGGERREDMAEEGMAENEMKKEDMGKGEMAEGEVTEEEMVEGEGGNQGDIEEQADREEERLNIERACGKAGYEGGGEDKEKGENEKRGESEENGEGEGRESGEKDESKEKGGSGEEAKDKENGNREGDGPGGGEVEGGSETPEVRCSKGGSGDAVIEKKGNPEEEMTTSKPILCESIIEEGREEGGGVALFL
ncbi:hypothetical protein HOY80DRAFT_1023517 [Tuber brumale]|nr:hypothetical protein HOY80DRAFT_1023517 [Tuber brumale]